MNYFTISDIESLSGIKAHTLRAWEIRYKILVPKRKDSLHRYYDGEDLRNVLQVKTLYDKGHKISQIAKMSFDERLALLNHAREQENLFEKLVQKMIDGIVNFNEEAFNNHYNLLIQYLGTEKMVETVLYPVLENIGSKWLTGDFCPAQEHFASYLIQKKLLLAIDYLETPRGGNITLLVNPLNEFHEIPLLYTQYLLKKRGQRSFLLGANTSNEVLKDYAGKETCRTIIYYLNTNLTKQTPEELASDLCLEYKSHKILFCGPAAEKLNVTYPNLQKLAKLKQLHQYINSL